MLTLIPTDTCYGLAGAFIAADYLEIYRLKGRDFDKLLAILVEELDDMRRYIEISDEHIEFLRTYPYPWSFLGKRK
jgi:tRNA A37 threonylcarbamoyladenosine synthetase subunit TsaC/SUA5/YrdC